MQGQQSNSGHQMVDSGFAALLAAVTAAEPPRLSASLARRIQDAAPACVAADPRAVAAALAALLSPQSTRSDARRFLPAIYVLDAVLAASVPPALPSAAFTIFVRVHNRLYFVLNPTLPLDCMRGV
ncbi:hypothetical protein HDU84_005580 [Entophlyctis sp. JEL0112]|nr:hypothetical protein HDU84_005580 [Entophlyctis sp. JEL0112]